MPYRCNPFPHRPAAQAEAAAGAVADVSSGLDVLDAPTLARLGELDPGGKAGLVGRVLQTYTRSLERGLAQLSSARAVGDGVTMSNVAHTLKSSSASVGALSLSSLCADIEARLRDDRRDGLEAQLDRLCTEAQRILAGLSSAPGPT